MKICHSEAMKLIKDLEDKKAMLLQQERNRSTYSYLDEKAKIIPCYSYSKTREAVDKLDAKIRALRHALAVSNCSVQIEEFGASLGEALVMLAQWQRKYEILQAMSSRQQIYQQSTYNGMEITECNYDVETVLADCEKLRKKIAKLQIAIDKANLLNYIEAEI